MKRYPLSPLITSFASVFKDNGHALYLVGGCIRDYLLGIKTTDYDFATDATPQQMMAMFSRVIPTGIKHGTVTILYKSLKTEVTTFRKDGTYHDSRHPDTVTFVSTIADDLSRRDFTINALAADATTGEIIDLFDGIHDLKRKTIKAIGIPQQRFKEDALRMLRACRFAAKLGFSIEKNTLQAIKEMAKDICLVSPERIADELNKTMLTPLAGTGIRAMEESGLLAEILPELTASKGIEQGGMHKFDVYEHSLRTLEAAANLNASFQTRWAALLHDIGKPQAQAEKSGCITFYRHEFYSAKLAEQIFTRLKFSNQHKEIITHLISQHMFHYTSDWTDAAVRRFIAKTGIETLPLLLDLRRADQIAICGKADEQLLGEFAQRIKIILEAHAALGLKDLAVHGDDLAEIGIPKGPHMGIILNQLLETVLDDQSQNTKEQLLVIATNLHSQIRALTE